MQATRPPTRVPRSGFQAIRDGHGRTVGFELFFRDSEASVAASERTTAATVQVLADHAVSSEADRRRLYFVNVTRDFLVGKVEMPDPSVIAVLEVQPDVVVDAEVLAGVARLRERGYGIALDRYVFQQGNEHDRLLPFASHVKLDLDDGDDQALELAASVVRERSRALLIGTKIGTRERHERARQLGCDLFQGRAMDSVQRATSKLLLGSLAKYSEVLVLLAMDDDLVEMPRVATAVMEDPDLSMRVLRACNNASVGLRQPLSTIRQAVVAQGLRKLRELVLVGVAQGLAVDGTDRLFTLVQFAQLTDLVGERLGLARGSGFLVGLLAQVAEVTETPIADVLRAVPLAGDLADGLLHRTGPSGQALSIIDCYRQHEPKSVACDGLKAITMQEVWALHVEANIIASGVSDSNDPQAQEVVQSIALPPVWQGPETGDGDAPVTEALDRAPTFGPAPTPEQVAEARAWNASSQERARQLVRQESVPLDHLQGELGLDDHEFHVLKSTNRLLIVDIDEQRYVPCWQFAPTGHLLDGLDDVLTSFPGDALSLAEWLIRPSVALGGQPPVLLLSQGEHERVVDHVRGMRTW